MLLKNDTIMHKIATRRNSEVGGHDISWPYRVLLVGRGAFSLFFNESESPGIYLYRNPREKGGDFCVFGSNGDGMLRAALGTAFLSAVKNLIGIVSLSSCASLPPEIYRMLPPVVFIFFLF